MYNGNKRNARISIKTIIAIAPYILGKLNTLLLKSNG